jgi:hypothetical protein
MPIARVQLPDGRIGRFEVPEGTTPEQVQAFAGSQVEPEEEGLLTRVGREFTESQQERGRQLADVFTGVGAEDQTLPETILQVAGTEIGAAGDVVGQAVVEAARAAPESVKEVAADVTEGVLSTEAGQAGLNAIQTGAEAYQAFKEENPRAARNIEAGFNVAAFFTPVKGVSAAKLAKKGADVSAEAAGAVVGDVIQNVAVGAKAAIDFTPEIKKGLAARAAGQLEVASDALKTKTGQAYQAFEEAGGAIKQGKLNTLPADISKKIAEKTPLNKTLHRKTISVLDDLSESIRAGKNSLVEVEQQRRLLSRVANEVDSIGRATDDAFTATIALKTVDDFVDGLKSVDALGDKGAVSLLKTARDEARRSRKFDIVADIVKKADGDPNKIKSGFKRFIDKPKNLKGFTEAEKDALRTAAVSTTGEKLLKAFGKFGFDLGTSVTPGNTALPALAIGAGAAGLPITPLLAAGGTAARVGQKGLARGRGEDVLQLIEGLR